MRGYHGSCSVAFFNHQKSSVLALMADLDSREQYGLASILKMLDPRLDGSVAVAATTLLTGICPTGPVLPFPSTMLQRSIWGNSSKS